MNNYRTTIALKLIYNNSNISVEYDYVNQYLYLKELFEKQKEDMNALDLHNYDVFIKSINESIDYTTSYWRFDKYIISIKFSSINVDVTRKGLYLHLDVCTNAPSSIVKDGLVSVFGSRAKCLEIQLALPNEVSDWELSSVKKVYRFLILNEELLVTLSAKSSCLLK